MKVRVGTWLLFLAVLGVTAGCIDVTPATVSSIPTSAAASPTATTGPMALGPTSSPSPTAVPDTPTVAPTPTRTPFRRLTPTPPPTDTPIPAPTPTQPAVVVVTPGAATTPAPVTTVIPAQVSPSPTAAVPPPTPTRPVPPPTPTLGPGQPLPGGTVPTATTQPVATVAAITPTPSATPTRVPPTLTPTPLVPALVKAVDWLPNCGLTQVKLQIHDPLGFRKNGLRFKIESDGAGWSAVSFPTGLGGYEPGETDFTLNNRPISNTWHVWLLDRQGRPVEPRLTITTDTNDCRPGGIGHQVAVVEWLWFREP
ncbi:MAG: hypothetical protein HY331_09470 [Chloroflexi bacterium]|nr:hypothetical protein [Chloroflexota bacterium]